MTKLDTALLLYISDRPIKGANLGVVDGYGKGDARAGRHEVDADGLAVQVDKRPARVAGGDGRVCLQVLRNLALGQDVLHAHLSPSAAHGARSVP